MEFEAYIHENGDVIVKRYIPQIGLFIDKSSPFVKKYLGVIESENIQKAKEIFISDIRERL